VLHEGLIGYLGEQKLQEIVYKDMDKAKSKAFKDVTGGWLGMTDKYWASAIIPSRTRPIRRPSASPSRRDPGLRDAAVLKPADRSRPGQRPRT
jgi:YidC/Oxa1 family membrane protein insertase